MKHHYLNAVILTASLMLSASTLSAYDNVAATFSWPVGNESEATLSEGIADAVSVTGVSIGTDLQITSTATTYTLGDDGTVGPYVTYLPGTSNPGNVTTDMIEYTVQVKKGITFTPTSVSYDAVKESTDNSYFSWSYTIDGIESDITAYSNPKTQIRRNNNANPSAPLTHTEAVSAEGGQKVTLRLYLCNVANNKKMSIGNVKINGTLSGEAVARSFKDFELNFMNISELPAKPEGVITLEGTPRNDAHGLNSDFKLVVPADGPVKITLGGCQYSGTHAKVMDGETLLTEIDVKTPGCYHNGGTASWTYNSETATTLTIIGAQYNPYIKMEACDLIPMRTITYYDVDGKTVIGTEEVEGGSALTYKYGASDVTVADGYRFRGWFNSTQATALKVAEGTSIQENLTLYAKATPIEVATVGSIYTYPLNSTSFYIEDHECITATGAFHDAQHGYSFSADQNIALQTAGSAVVVFGLCKYSSESDITVTDAAGNTVATIPAKVTNDGATASVTYIGGPTTLTATCGGTTYMHNVTIYNVESVPVKGDNGYYELAPGDGASLQLVLAGIQEGDMIYLPNGVYDFGEKALTTISANNVSIVGESMEGTIIRNAPDKSNEGIASTATLLNTSNGLYLQDLTLQNALDYYAAGSAGRAVCLQDKGKNTICKNVRMLSYQDTYYSNAASNFYWEDSEIHGTVDYLCGDGNVVYNRVKLVNESRSKSGNSGDCTICAPYNTATTEARYNWGYVFLDCTVETKSATFNFGRAWGGEPKATYVNTTILEPSKLAKSRFTAAGMNVAAASFKEYNTLNPAGEVISPESNVMNFTHSTGNKSYETILTDEEAAAFTIANIYGEWAPDVTAAQVTKAEEIGLGAKFLVDGKITTERPASGEVRVANSRGGFGPVIDLTADVIESIAAPATREGKTLINGQLIITKGGNLYNAAGVRL